MITSVQYSAHNIGRNQTTQKTKVTVTRFFMIQHISNAFSSSKSVIWTLWTCISGFEYSRNDVNVNRDDVDRNIAVHVWHVEHTLNIVLNHSISNKICFNLRNALLKMIRIISRRFICVTGVYG